MNPTLKQILIAAVGVLFAAVIGGVIVVLKRLREVEMAQAVLKQEVVPLSMVYQAQLIAKLTHYHTPETDALMVKLGTIYEPPTISEEEMEALFAAMDQRTRDMGPEIDDEERNAARELPSVARTVRREIERIAKGERFEVLRMVGVLHEGESGEPDHSQKSGF